MSSRIVVTGIASRLGRLVARHLHRLGEGEVVGIDRRPVAHLPKDVVHLAADIRSRKARDVFRHDVKALIHIALYHQARTAEQRSFNVMGTARLLDYCERYGVEKVIVLSSAEVYGPRPDNHQFLKEDAPLMGAVGFSALQELVTADMQATSYFWQARHSQTDAVVLRPVHILGGLHNPPSNFLRLRHPPVPIGFDPMIQVVHELDVVQAVMRALGEGVHGVFNIAGPGELPLSVLLGELGKRPIRVPYGALKAGVSLLHKVGLSRFSSPEIEHLRFVGMVDSARAARVLGYRSRYNLRETVRAVVDYDEL
ncbi:MAG: NAD-dependent epimerase/dehydratase family protein [Deltaproteobacteria bacterium]|nr:NAD-dependent epimerase/dehydratase family protein [Deltaproteobacteria bacterium]